MRPQPEMAYQLHKLPEPPARQGVCVCITGQEWRKPRDGDVFGNRKIQLIADLPTDVGLQDTGDYRDFYPYWGP